MEKPVETVEKYLQKFAKYGISGNESLRKGSTFVTFCEEFLYPMLLLWRIQSFYVKLCESNSATIVYQGGSS